MTFDEVLEQSIDMLKRRGRVSYGALRRQFALDDDYLEDLKIELVEVLEVATDKDDKMLVWQGETDQSSPSEPPPSSLQSPSNYTPQHLAERIRAEQTAMESRGSADGERKTITALFADLKGSTTLIEGLDPEEARAIIDPALQLMMDAVHRYDGYVAQALGDGIFALFGAPVAHEDHPQRALYAALHMQETMQGYSDDLRLKGCPPLQMRVGINTGEVVVRSIRKDDLHTDYVPVGHSTNLAARMEQLANPGSILVSEYTYKLTDGYFVFNALGAAEIKGVDEPLNVYEVTGAGTLRTRLQVSARRGLSRFVGRHSEMEQLQAALEQARVGQGQIVGVMGEPGLGKSRLFHEFVGAYGHTPSGAADACLVLQAFAVSHGQSSPYLPLIELLKNYFQIESTDDDRTRKEKATGRVLILDRSLEDTLPYLFALLGIEDPDATLQQMDAKIRRQRTFESLKKLFLRESLNQPLILIFEDLHWIDSETQGFLDTLSESIASAQLLLLTNYRPEYQHEWNQKTYYAQVRLAPLGKAEADELLTFLLGTDSSLTALKTQILDKTEGTPFFMEEVVQELVEQGVLERTDVGVRPTEGAHVGAPLQIPQTVQGILAARIDRLTAEEKLLLQQLSVIGRQFPMSLITAVVPQSEDECHRALASLQSKEFLYEQPAFPEVEYIFKHALTQDVAYGTVLHEQRKSLHEQTGQAIEKLYHDTLEDRYSALAHHYARSDNHEKAIIYLGLAGQQAAQRSANQEAITLLEQAISLVQRLSETPQKLQQELTLQATLGPLLMAAKGYGAQETEKAYSRAYDLCQRLENTAQLVPILWGLQQLYCSIPDYQKAREYGEQIFALAKRSHDPSLLVWANRTLTETSYFVGNFPTAIGYSEYRITWSNAEQRRAQLIMYGEDPSITAFACYWMALFALGYPDQALDKVREALALGREIIHANSLALTTWFSALLHFYRREPEEAQEQVETVINLTTEHGIQFWLELGLILRGYALIAQGDLEAGIAEFHRGRTAHQTAGTAEGDSCFLALLAEGYWKNGQVEEGLSVLAEALDFVEKTDERFYEAELYRLKGEMTLQQSKVEDAETCFQTAIEIAQKQSAKSWELRAAMSLARLWQEQGKNDEARELLAPVYNWFTEGFDTADLKEAKALLEELSA